MHSLELRSVKFKHVNPIQLLLVLKNVEIVICGNNVIQTLCLYHIKIPVNRKRKCEYLSLCVFDAQAVHHLIFHSGRLTVQDGIMDGGEQAGLCHIVFEEISSLKVVHHTSWKGTEIEMKSNENLQSKCKLIQSLFTFRCVTSIQDKNKGQKIS